MSRDNINNNNIFEVTTMTPTFSLMMLVDDDYGNVGDDVGDDFSIRLSSLTPQQEKVLAILGVFSSILSMIGSSTIVYKVLKNLTTTNRHRTSTTRRTTTTTTTATITTPYDRLLLGLSSCDFIASIGFAMSPFWLPADSSQRVWAIGTNGTCTMLGWITQFSFAAVVYNGLLSFYYLLTVKYGVKRREFAEKYEFGMHASVLLFFFGTATMGAIIGLYNEMELGFACWANDYPKGCHDDDCTSHLFGWAIGALPCFLTLLALITNNVLVYGHVQKILGTDAATNSRVLPHGSFESTVRAMERASRQVHQIQEVATQGFFYVGTFFLAYTAGFVVRILESMGYGYEHEADIYIFLALNAFLLPLQGFFNMFVYNRPNYIRFRKAYPQQSKIWAMGRACLDPNIPRLSMIRTSFNTNGTRGSNRSNKKKSGMQDPNLYYDDDDDDDDDDDAYDDNNDRYEKSRMESETHRNSEEPEMFSIHTHGSRLFSVPEEEDEESDDDGEPSIMIEHVNNNKRGPQNLPIDAIVVDDGIPSKMNLSGLSSSFVSERLEPRISNLSTDLSTNHVGSDTKTDQMTKKQQDLDTKQADENEENSSPIILLDSDIDNVDSDDQDDDDDDDDSDDDSLGLKEGRKIFQEIATSFRKSSGTISNASSRQASLGSNNDISHGYA